MRAELEGFGRLGFRVEVGFSVKTGLTTLCEWGRKEGEGSKAISCSCFAWLLRQCCL